MAAKEYYSLSRSQVVNKARGYGQLRDTLVDLLRDAPMKKAGFIGDKNWNGKGNWMIKVSEENMKHVIKKLGKGKETKKARTYQIPGKVVGGKSQPVSLRFRVTSKVEPTKAGTAEQEKGSAYIFDRVVNKSVKYNSWEDIVADVEGYDALVKIFNGDVPDSWLISYYAQQKVLLQKVQPSTMVMFDHSGTGSFMEFITDLCLKNFNTKYTLGGKKDSWNPADIWIVKKAEMNKIKKELEQATTTIHELNDVLRQMFIQKRVMGISLKKTGKVAYYEEVNIDKSLIDIDTKEANFPCPMTALQSNFKIKSGDDMFTQDVKITVEGGGKTYIFQIKANSSDDVGGSNLKFEPTAKGSGTARLGKAPVDKVVKLLKDDFDKTFENNHKIYPKDKTQFESNFKGRGEKYYTDKVLPALLNVIDTDMRNVKEVIANIKASYGGKKDRGTNTKAKLMGLDFFYQISKLTEPQRREFVTDMCYLAQKKAFKKFDYFGPFGKIY